VTQIERILGHLKTVGTLTSLEAAGLYRCRQLPARVWDLKRDGHSIRTELKEDHTGQRYARYHYEGEAS
jgi:hypothetical protein